MEYTILDLSEEIKSYNSYTYTAVDLLLFQSIHSQ